MSRKLQSCYTQLKLVVDEVHNAQLPGKQGSCALCIAPTATSGGACSYQKYGATYENVVGADGHGQGSVEPTMSTASHCM